MLKDALCGAVDLDAAVEGAAVDAVVGGDFGE
ncbi:hypothetical protein ACTIVE_0759 [Actinomadura verrucosospora]|uniref:Uncharacterized protein n=1 Tax=Actinomadura verrucosospora TaxID=46165 RepID=A0A7D3ZIN6_ACTVE|nr:hypothetical protein ACTIVE_0759 [Actinomadura verrucosospora]